MMAKTLAAKRTFRLEDFELFPNVANRVKSPDDDVTWFYPVVYTVAVLLSWKKSRVQNIVRVLKFDFPSVVL